MKGIVELRDDPYVIIDVSGVGYKVYATLDVLSTIRVGDETKVFIYTHVREDILDLYGFSKYADLRLFEKLLGVSGIGPKTAIGVFSLGSSSDIVSAIISGNVAFFSSVPRLGKKNAQKIIIELKGKIGSTQDLDLTEGTTDSMDVVTALKSFGFSQKEAEEAVSAVNERGGSTEEKIRLALKYLGK
ncbi:MAG: Holliday junction branch migration protein RuvA [Candidatus Levybacteria bacterium]|nr:Holliday junction branch migration protein RuvA [Candidatus Levybacteria bacterium]